MTQYGFVHLEFGSGHRELSLEVLSRFRQAMVGQGDRASLVIVDNALAEGGERYEGQGFVDARVIAGDNSNREFSGWDKGIPALIALSGEPDVWIFTNDTFARHHGWSEPKAARFGAETRRLAGYLGPWMFGEFVDFPGPMTTPLGPCMQYASTYCFAMNRALRQELGQLSPGNTFLDSLVNERFEAGHGVFSDKVDAGYVDFVSAWLIDDGSDEDRQKRFGWAHEWHNKSVLSALTFDDLRMKARCCLSETLLSVRARKLGADFRSLYDPLNARDRIRKTGQYVLDKLWEKRILKKQRQRANSGAPR